MNRTDRSAATTRPRAKPDERIMQDHQHNIGRGLRDTTSRSLHQRWSVSCSLDDIQGRIARAEVQMRKRTKNQKRKGSRLKKNCTNVTSYGKRFLTKSLKPRERDDPTQQRLGDLPPPSYLRPANDPDAYRKHRTQPQRHAHALER